MASIPFSLMKRRNGPDFGGQFSPAQRGQLIGMELGEHAVPLPSLQNPPGLLQGKDSLLAEYIAEAGEFLLGHGRDHLFNNPANVFFRPP
jgi:hypothetical protein